MFRDSTPLPPECPRPTTHNAVSLHCWCVQAAVASLTPCPCRYRQPRPAAVIIVGSWLASVGRAHVQRAAPYHANCCSHSSRCCGESAPNLSGFSLSTSSAPSPASVSSWDALLCVWIQCPPFATTNVRDSPLSWGGWVSVNELNLQTGLPRCGETPDSGMSAAASLQASKRMACQGRRWAKRQSTASKRRWGCRSAHSCCCCCCCTQSVCQRCV